MQFFYAASIHRTKTGLSRLLLGGGGKKDFHIIISAVQQNRKPTHPLGMGRVRTARPTARVDRGGCTGTASGTERSAATQGTITH